MPKKYFTVMTGAFKKGYFDQIFDPKSFQFKMSRSMPEFLQGTYDRNLTAYQQSIPNRKVHTSRSVLDSVSTLVHNSLQDQMATVLLCSDMSVQRSKKTTETAQPEILIGVEITERDVQDYWVHKHTVDTLRSTLDCAIESIIVNPRGMWPKAKPERFLSVRERTQVDLQGLLNDVVAPSVGFLDDFSKRVKITHFQT
jgi:hypothetical protein